MLPDTLFIVPMIVCAMFYTPANGPSRIPQGTPSRQLQSHRTDTYTHTMDNYHAEGKECIQQGSDVQIVMKTEWTWY